MRKIIFALAVVGMFIFSGVNSLATSGSFDIKSFTVNGKTFIKIEKGTKVSFELEIEELVSTTAVHTGKYRYEIDFGDGSPKIIGYTDYDYVKLYHTYKKVGYFEAKDKVTCDGVTKERTVKVLVYSPEKELKIEINDGNSVYEYKEFYVRVLERDTSRPVKGAKVTLRKVGHLLAVDYGYTSSNGVVKLTPEDHGRYVIEVKKYGYRGLSKRIDVLETPELCVSVYPSKPADSYSTGVSIPFVVEVSTGKVEFTTLSVDVENNISTFRYRYYIDWGDGSIPQIIFTERKVIEINHIYRKEGRYVIRVRVIDFESGGEGEGNYEIKITRALRNSEPIAVAEVPSIGYVNEVIVLNASQSYDPDGIIVNYTWYLGNGDVVYGEKALYTYKQEGRYTIKLVITDNNGSKGIAYKSI